MAAPSMVFTARYAARHFGVDPEVIEELAEEMAPEDGCLSVVDSLDDNTEWTCPGKVESSLEMKGELDDEAEAFYERV